MAIPQGGTRDLTIRQGATFSVVFAARESDATTVVDLTGYTARAQIRTRRGDGVLLFEFEPEVDAEAGTVTLSATAEDTAAMDRGGFYDVELVQADEVIRFVQGRVSLNLEVTREEPA